MIIANNDSATTPAVTPVAIDVLANDTLDGNPVTLGALAGPPTVTSPPAHGTVVWNPATNSFDYTPAPGFCGTDTFEYEIETAPPPVNTLAPSIAGDPYIGETLTATPGTWTGSDSVSGEWYVDGVATGDTDTSYTILLADAGKPVEYRETATNGAGSVTQASNTISIGSLTVQVQALFGKYSAAGGMWDFTDMSTLFQDSAGSTPVTASGQSIGLVLDLSGSGNPFYMSTSSQRPSWVGSRLVTDGIDDRMFTDAVDFSTASGYTIGVRMSADLSVNQYPTIITCDRHPWLSPNNSFGIFYNTDSVRLEAFNRRPGGHIWRALPQPSVVTPEYTLVSSGKASFSGAADGVGFWKGGVYVPLSADASATGALPNAPITIGSSVDGYYFSQTSYARAFAIAAEVSAEDRAIVEAWLAEVAP